MPGGKVYATENGCFAKTFGLDPSYEPTIYNATHQAGRLPGERLVRRAGQGRLLRHLLHQERPDDLSVLQRRPVAARARSRRRLPADPEPQREHHPGRGPAGPDRRPRPTSCSARRPGPGRRQGRGGQVPARPRTNPFFPRDMADMGNRMLELLDSHPIEVVRAEHRPRRRRRRRRRLEEGHDPLLLRDRAGHRRGHHRVGPRIPTSATRWPRRSRRRRHRDPPARGSTSGRAGPTSTKPWWPGSSGSGRSSLAPSRPGRVPGQVLG